MSHTIGPAFVRFIPAAAAALLPRFRRYGLQKSGDLKSDIFRHFAAKERVERGRVFKMVPKSDRTDRVTRQPGLFSQHYFVR